MQVSHQCQPNQGAKDNAKERVEGGRLWNWCAVDGLICNAWRMVNGVSLGCKTVFLSYRPKIKHSPYEKAAKQDHVGTLAVTDQVREGPNFYTQNHRMLQFGFDVVIRDKGAHQHDQSKKHQQDREMLGKERRGPPPC